MKHIHLADLAGYVGKELGSSEWITVDQETIDSFAKTTGDSQWVHVDEERASQGPFGATIAHGFLTLSIIPQMLRGIYSVDGLAMTANYGLNKVRFPTPVLAGSRVRTRAELILLENKGTHVQLILRATVELDGSHKPACVADIVMRLTPVAEFAVT